MPGAQPIGDTLDEGVIALLGNRATAERFVTLFQLPRKVE